MKPQQTIPIIASTAEFLAVAPPILIVAAIGLGLYWLLSSEEKAQRKAVDWWFQHRKGLQLGLLDFLRRCLWSEDRRTVAFVRPEFL